MRQSQVIPKSAKVFSISILIATLVTGCVTPQPAPKPVNLTTVAPAPATAAAAAIPVYARSAPSNTRQKIDHEFFVNADCTTGGIPVVVIVAQPTNGTLWSEPGSDYPLFVKENQRYDCNKLAIPGTGLFYKSNPNFYGTDTATVHIINPNGTFRDASYSIIVK